MAKRVAQGVATVLVLVTFVFVGARALGDPMDLLLAPDASEDVREALAENWGLDRPLHEQLVIYMSRLFSGDLGDSIRYRRPVSEMYFDAIPNTAKLTLAALGIAVTVGVPLGVLAAVKRGRSLDTLATSLAVFGVSAPSFWLGLMLIAVLAVRLRWFPVAGMGTPFHYVLPAFTVSVALTAGIVRLLRSSMLDLLDAEFTKLARIKGASERRVVWVHCFRNAVPVLLSYSAVYVSVLLTGSIVVEVVFAWPGVGRLLYDAITARDYPVIQGVVMLSGFLIVLVNLAADIARSIADPRLRHA